jgi:outer membrane cobalamin receptor
MRTKVFVLTLSFTIFLNLNFLTAQQIQIKGKISDINTHRAIPHVNIYVKGSSIGTISDFSGRFNLEVPKPHTKMIVIFQHINYDIKEISINKIKESDQYYLQPRVIPLPEIEVEAKGDKLEIAKDLPQMISVVKAKEFEVRGYVDAGDLLRTDHSVQVDEELSGKKTISMRGGNPDDVVVLYNGVKMNSEFNNVFDFSMIDLEDIERFEIIKGSNTALYGSEAFSGVINIVPKTEQDYTIRFQQRIGTYDSGNWGLHFYQKFGKLHSSYRFRQGGAKRRFSDAEDDSEMLENRATHHTANLVYRLSESSGGIAKNTLGVMYIRSDMDYNDYRDDELVSNFNQIIGIRYNGDIFKLRHLNLSLSQHWMEETQALTSANGWLDRGLKDESINLHAEKTFNLRKMELLFAYQFENANLDFSDERSDYSVQNFSQETAILQRTRHGVASILKIHAPSGSDVVKDIDFDVSFRQDRVQDKIADSGDKNSQSTIDIGSENDWTESMIKFATKFSSYYQNFTFDVFMNIGTNVKFPTLSQLISSQLMFNSYSVQRNLNPEKNKSVEIGLVLKRDLRYHPTIYGWQISGNYINNHYENKFRPYFVIGLPITFYDTVIDAKISGFETKSSIFLLKKKITVEFGLSYYDISEKAAFPFKYDMKQIFNLMVDHAGYSFLFHWFREGEQTAWMRQLSGNFSEIMLPEYANIDIHLSKTFRLWRLKLFGNFSIRNLLDDDYELEGLALRDRRYYITVGAQY